MQLKLEVTKMLIAKVHNAKYIIEKPKMTILIQSDSKIVLPEIKKKLIVYKYKS